MSYRRPFFLEWDWVIALEVLFAPVIGWYKTCSCDTPFVPRIVYGALMGLLFFGASEYSFLLSSYLCIVWEVVSAIMWITDERWSRIVGTLMDAFIFIAVIYFIIT